MKKLKLQELNRPDINTYQTQTEKIKVILIADNIRSALNIGSIFRTADAFCVEKIILCGITATPPNREINKTALGATESVFWAYSPNTLFAVEMLKNDGYTIIAIEQTNSSVMLDNYPIQKSAKYALILGNEVDGVSEDIFPLVDDAIEIPQLGTKHSLNVSVAGGIVLWEFFKALSR